MRNLSYQLQIAFLIWLAFIAVAVVWPKTEDSKPKVANSVLSESNSDTVNLPPTPALVAPPKLRLTAASYTSLDVSSGRFLLQSNADSLHAPASTAKLTLAWAVRRKCSLNQVVTVREPFKVGSVLGLKQGEQFTVNDLLYALLLPSDNDAAIALADGCLGSQETAVAAMNSQVQDWGLSDTHFINVHGLDNLGNYSTAHNLALIAKFAMTDPILSQIVKISTHTITSKDGTPYQLKSTNILLGTLGVSGIKTGSTDLAGENFISRADVRGHQVITVVLGSTDRFTDTRNLLLEITKDYRWNDTPPISVNSESH